MCPEPSFLREPRNARPGLPILFQPDSGWFFHQSLLKKNQQGLIDFKKSKSD
jgi:acetone carboxylase gamma subunit